MNSGYPDGRNSIIDPQGVLNFGSDCKASRREFLQI
jgi:hypothetical protein